MTSEILRLHDLELCKRWLLTLLLRLQRHLLQVANLGTSSSRKTFILVADVTLETFNGTVPMEESVVTSAKALKVG